MKEIKLAISYLEKPKLEDLVRFLDYYKNKQFLKQDETLQEFYDNYNINIEKEIYGRYVMKMEDN